MVNLFYLYGIKDSDQEFHAKTLFYQGSYAACHSVIDSMNDPPFQMILFSARSLIASREPSAKALNLLAKYYSNPPSSEKDRERIAEEAESLTEEILDEENDGKDSMLRVTLAALLVLSDNLTMAIFLLRQGVQLHSLESVALLISIYLSPRLRRPDLARSLYRSAKSWADDAMLLQMAEAWIGASTGSAAASKDGREPGGYQSAFYVFDESSNSSNNDPSKLNLVALNGKAVTQLAMGHLEEAQANLEEALKSNPEDETTLANLIVLSAHLDSSSSEGLKSLEKLKSINSKHPLIEGLEKHESLFEEASSKFVASKV
ncbi:coatomer epsilon subunit-domain-containing protein [Phakopsora pachyrhizi]|uniref:Coatomer epsilon subunit-domain-containing protein n=1 Tax=Phakopsora pachyrhizi TaxID=170000 RepID=A0AAV0AG88_PHAPC|nr:coatomer epsilon subunit-domain-containing protein [Phakopsora pachyrhizi]